MDGPAIKDEEFRRQLRGLFGREDIECGVLEYTGTRGKQKPRWKNQLDGLAIVEELQGSDWLGKLGASDDVADVKNKPVKAFRVAVRRTFAEVNTSTKLERFSLRSRTEQVLYCFWHTGLASTCWALLPAPLDKDATEADAAGSHPQPVAIQAAQGVLHAKN
jgi:hypothetical protein